MSEVVVHHGMPEIETRRLVWEKSLLETRFPHFSLQYSWYRQTAQWFVANWEPLLIEVMWDGRTLGLVPLFSHRESPRWVSPNLLTGIGPAAILGKEVTAAWLRIVYRLRSLLPEHGQLQLGPFEKRTGVASRLETAFANSSHRPPAVRTLSRKEWDLASFFGASPTAARNSSVEMQLDSSLKNSAHPRELKRETWERLEGLFADPRMELHSPISALQASRDATLEIIDRFTDCGLISVSYQSGTLLSENGIRSPNVSTIVWLGDQHDAIPLVELRPSSSPPSAASLKSTARALNQLGVARLSHLPGDWPVSEWLTPQPFRTFTIAHKLNLRQTISQWSLSDVSEKVSRLWRSAQKGSSPKNDVLLN